MKVGKSSKGHGTAVRVEKLSNSQSSLELLVALDRYAEIRGHIFRGMETNKLF